VLVAQIFNLLYRRLAVGKAVKNTGSFEISEIVIPSRGLIVSVDGRNKTFLKKAPPRTGVVGRLAQRCRAA
ncbi:MAG TPA: hypothetical protein VG754_06355, partial [Verrucomicrobiae bacterium]|nr:hypothetical protein [Verrucomicrobiae bacterium]